MLDVTAGQYDTDTIIDAGNCGLEPSEQPWGVNLRRLNGGPSDGIDLVTLDNGHLRLSILPTRGMGIWKVQCGDLPLKWDSPVTAPVHPALVDQSRRGGIGWLDGFNELICRCGLNWHGAPGTDTRRDEAGDIVSEQFLPLHGRVANLPAHRVWVEVENDGTISVLGEVDETSVFGERLRLTSRLSTTPGSSSFSIQDTITNLGSAPAEAELLYHCNFGTPMLGAGASFHTAATRVAPRDARAAEGTHTWETFEGPTQGYAEQVYFMTPISDATGRGLAVLRDPEKSAALALRFHTNTLPWLTLWKNTQAAEDGYCCGIEPSSSLPNNRQFEREQGRVLNLASQQSAEFNLSFEIAENTDAVQALIDEVDTLQEQQNRTTESQPAADLSPA